MAHRRATLRGALPLAPWQPAAPASETSVQDDRTALHVLADAATFQAALGCAWQRAIRERHEVSLLMLAVDARASAQASTRHWAVDAVAQVLQARIRRPGDLIARHDSADFAILLPCTHPIGATLLARELCATIDARHVAAVPGEAAVTVAIGATGVQPDPDMTPDRLVSAALAALADARCEGGNRVVQAGGRVAVGRD